MTSLDKSYREVINLSFVSPGSLFWIYLKLRKCCNLGQKCHSRGTSKSKPPKDAKSHRVPLDFPPTKRQRQISLLPNCRRVKLRVQRQWHAHIVAGGRMSDEAGQWSATSGSAHCYTGRCIVLLGYTGVWVVVYEVLLRRCRETKREREREREREKENNRRAERTREPPW